MALTPIDVENTQFKVAFRGYAIDEVDAFLDRVQAELARLLTEQSGGSRVGASTTAGTTAGVSGLEGQEVALRTLMLAQRTADEAVAEARAEAQEILAAARDQAGATVTAAREEAESVQTAARTEADETLTSARSEAEATLASARSEAEATLASARSEAEATLTSARGEAEATRTGAAEEAERLVAGSRAEAAALEEQIAQRLEAALGDLDRRRQRLEASVEHLRVFEREYRTRLRAYIESQLRELGSGAPEDEGAGVPVGAGGAAVGRSAPGAVRLGRRPSQQDGRPQGDPSAGLVTAPDPAAPTTDR